MRVVALNRLLRLSLAAASVATMAGCGQFGSGLMAPLGRTAESFGALADFPDIAQQIAKATISTDERGTLVKQLPVPGRTKPVTFLTYKALDNNLGTTLPEHLNILERAGSSANVNALAFTDDIGPNNTFTYYLRQDNDPKTITSPFMSAVKRGEANTGSGATVARAMRWGFGQYPSKLRWMDINNHGGGYYGIAQDDTSDHIIRLPELAKGLKLGEGDRPIDVLSFDACLMATAEVAFELRDTARVMVASEDSSYALGMNYDKSLRLMSEKPATDSAALGRDLVERAERKGKTTALFTISAIDLGKAEGVSRAVDQLAGALIATLPRNKASVMMSLSAVKAFYVAGPDQSDFNHRDLNEVVDQLRARVPDPAVVAACQAVKATLFNKGGVILFARAANQEGKSPRGLSIYLPTNGQVDPIYKATAFAKATRWDEFLAALN